MSDSQQPDAILIDYHLGDMTGCDVLRWMRREKRMAPTAVLTALPGDFDPDEPISLGALAYSEVPVDIDDIVWLVRDLTRQPSPSDDPARLHARVLAGDPGAIECLSSVLLDTIPKRLEHTFPGAPWDFAEDAAIDGCLEYAANPTKFDRARLPSIVDFVYVISRRNLINRLRADVAARGREARYSRLWAVPFLPDFERTLELWSTITAVTRTTSERRATELWMSDAGDDAIAVALGYRHLVAAERQREAKRFKDRLLKRLSRRFGGR